MEKKIKLLPPESAKVNFIKTQVGESFGMISVTDLSDEEATEYAEVMKNEFLRHYYSKKKIVKIK